MSRFATESGLSMALACAASLAKMKLISPVCRPGLKPNTASSGRRSDASYATCTRTHSQICLKLFIRPWCRPPA